MGSRVFVVLAALGLAAAAGCGPAVGAKDGPTASAQAAVAAAVAPALVRVEIALRFDKGEEPASGGWGHSRCPVAKRSGLPVETAVKEERPFELAGFLIAPTRVVLTDPMIHPRFVEGIAVRQGDDVVKARLAAVATTVNAAFLDLERPLKGARPLAFDAARKPPYLAVAYHQEDGEWTVSVRGWSPAVSVSAAGRRSVPAPLQSLVVDEAGAAVGLSMDTELPADDSWKGSPAAWPAWSADETARMVADLEKRCSQGVLRVTLHLRSPKKETGGGRYRSRSDEESATETHVTGIVLGGGRLLVLANLKPKVTARLERIVVHLADGKDVAARFEGSLQDYGCLAAALEKLIDGAVALATAPVVDYRLAVMPAAEIRLHGEDRAAYFDHRRIAGFEVGWRQKIYPEVAGKDENLFLFDPTGALVALPVARREKVSSEDRYSADRTRLTPAAFLKAALDDLARNVDTHNVPLTEEAETRLAWLGVELQGLNKDLARANKVSELTRDGETGAVVSYVYPDSPAAKAGVEPGDILLRLRVEGEPKPLEVRIEEDERGPFPWERLDEVQEQSYDRIPPPWPPSENAFTRALTDLGFGKKFTAEFFHDGRLAAKDFQVTASPPHYDAAARFKAAALGLTVKDLTYEARRYFQRAADDPGVIVSKIEPGSKASVAGIKPFEIITHVNDRPVKNVKDFEAAIERQDELRLSVKRMTQGRVVKVQTTGPTPAPTPAPKAPAAATEP